MWVMDDSILTVSPEALEMILTLLAQEGDGEFGLLVEVKGFSAGQFQYELSFVEMSARKADQVLEEHGQLRILILERDVEKLRGSSLSLGDDGLSMNNPNVPASPTMTAVAGDLTGPLAEQVAQVLEQQVNPAIAMHGGAAELVSVDGSTAYLRLTGGCQGCGLAQVTLKQGIERILLDSIPELASVVDVTDHASGDNPYYERSKK